MMILMNYLVWISWFSKSFFMMIMIMTSILGISSSNLLLTWSFMEFNLLSFIPLITLSKTFNPQMLGLKYFFIQSLGSIILLLSILMVFMLNFNFIFNFLILISLMWKSGFAPFHMWVFSLVMDMKWGLILALMSWQKILPLYIMGKIYFSFWEFIVILSLIVSVAGSIFQFSIKKLIIFSSIFSSGWLFSSMIYFKSIWFLFLLLYSMMLFMMVIFLSSKKFSFKESESLLLFNMKEKIFIFILFLSMSGLPPLLGFFMKIMILFILISFKSFILSFMLVLSSILIMFMYVSIFLNSLTFFNSFNKMTLNYLNINFYLLFLVILIIGPLSFLI